jgi:uncharacterized protein YacL
MEGNTTKLISLLPYLYYGEHRGHPFPFIALRDIPSTLYDFRFAFAYRLVAIPIIACAIGMFITTKILHATTLLDTRHRSTFRRVIWLVVVVLYVILLLLRSNFSQPNPPLSGPVVQAVFDAVVYTVEHGGLVVGLLYGIVCGSSSKENETIG